jgi:hypothetical protein
MPTELELPTLAATCWRNMSYTLGGHISQIDKMQHVSNIIAQTASRPISIHTPQPNHARPCLHHDHSGCCRSPSALPSAHLLVSNTLGPQPGKANATLIQPIGCTLCFASAFRPLATAAPTLLLGFNFASNVEAAMSFLKAGGCWTSGPLLSAHARPCKSDILVHVLDSSGLSTHHSTVSTWDKLLISINVLQLGTTCWCSSMSLW